MLLAIDVGNTNTVLGLFHDNQLRCDWRVSTTARWTSDELAILLQALFEQGGQHLDEVGEVAISCVVPPILPALENYCRAYLHLDPLIVGPGIKTGMPIRYDDPREVGADRIVDSVAAFTQYGGPVIIVDFGTATTFDVVARDGAYLGGAIAPGIGIATEALFQHAAKLPRVELTRPPHAVGTNTVHSIQSGIIFGFAAQADGLITRIRHELVTPAVTVATGGLATLIAKESEYIDHVDPLLTLKGLRLVYDRNR